MSHLEAPNVSIPYNPEWFRPEVQVPEYLRQDQNLFDQPPFIWAFEDENIFPVDLFTPDKEVLGKIITTGVYVFHYSTLKESIRNDYSIAGMSTKQRLLFVNACLSEPFEDMKSFTLYMTELCNMLDNFFVKLNMESARDYVNYRIAREREFNQFGIRWDNSSFLHTTYIGWLEHKNDAIKLAEVGRQARKMIGLSNELPDAYSTVDDVIEAMPNKEKINRKFRLTGPSEALR